MLIRFIENIEHHRRKTVMSLAFVILFLFLSILLLSMAFIIMQTGHDCVGADCIVCVILKNMKNTLEQIGRVISIALLPGAFLLAFSIFLFFSSSIILPLTLIELNIKLNN